MRSTITKVLARMMLALGLVTMICVSPSPAGGDPESGWWNAGGDDPARETQVFLNPGWEGGYKTTNSTTGAVHTYEYKTDPNGDRIEVDQDYNVSKNGTMSNLSGLQTTTHKDKSTLVTRTDGTGHTTSEVDKDANGRLTSDKLYYKEGGYETRNYNPATGKQVSFSSQTADGSKTDTNYGPAGTEVSSSHYDAKTGMVTTTSYNQLGQVTGTSNYKQIHKLVIKPTQAGQQQQGLVGGKQGIKADAANQNVAAQAVPPATDSPKGQPPLQPHTNQTGATAGPNTLQTTTGTNSDGTEWKKVVDPATGKTEWTGSKKDPQTGVWTVNQYHYGGGQSETMATSTVYPDGTTHIEDWHYDKDMKKVTTSVTDRSGRGELEKTTTYDPKNGSMTSQATTDKFGNVSITHYTGQCSQFGGPNCHKTSESTSDGKTGKVTTTSFDQNGKVTSKVTRDAGDIAAARADALGRLKAGAGAKALKADTSQQQLMDNLKAKDSTGANELKADTKSKAHQGANKNVQADVLQQIGDKPSGDAKNAKDKLQAGDNKEKMKTGSKFMDEKLHSKSNNLQLGGTQQADVKSKGQDMTIGQKEKSSVMHNNRLPKQKVQQYTDGNKKVQSQSVKKFKEKKKEWHYPAGTANTNPVVR